MKLSGSKKRLAALMAAVLMAFNFVLYDAGCSKNNQDDDSSAQETSAEESSEQPKQESSKPKQESSKPKETSKPKEKVVEVDSSREVLADFSGLLSQNSDTVGWINVPDTPIDYVVVQSKEDAYLLTQGQDPYYLARDFNGNDYFDGSIFMDYRCDIGGKNMMMHGHSMADGTMFAGVLNFDSLDVYKDAPVLTFNTIYEKSKWKIIAVIKVNTQEYHGPLFNYLRSNFSSDYDFLNYVYQVRERSVIDCPVDVNEDDELITLSTCAYDFDNFRQAIIARKVRPGENAKVTVSKAKYNPDTLYPDVWYEYNGGTKPKVTSFGDMQSKGKITWYDGKKKYTAKDDQKLQEELAKSKPEAEKRIRASYIPADYDSQQQQEIEGLVKLFMESINDAVDVTQVEALTRQMIAVAQHYEKRGQKAREAEEEVKNARSTAINKMRAAVVGKQYSAKDQKQITALMEEYREKINNSSDKDKINSLAEEALKKLSKINGTN